MPRQPINIEELIIKYARGEQLSDEEMDFFRAWQARSEDHKALPEKFRDVNWLRENLRRLENVPSERMWDDVRGRIALDIQNEPTRAPGHLRRLRQWGPYAAALIIVVVCSWWWMHRLESRPDGADIPVPTIARVTNAELGNHQVLLTLGDGRSIPLDHVPNGKVAESDDLILTKTDSNELTYTLKPGSTETAINSRITTGQASPFRLVFPDGSKVQLAYASSLSTSFREGQRMLALSGEALFESAKNSHQPMTVQTKKAQVQVLGTVFDVSSYEDEAEGTVSLFSGAVKVTHREESKVLKPLQQAVMKDGRLDVHRLRDSADVLAWTREDPLFNFENTDLNTVIRRIARWYQVKVYNPDNVTGAPITGLFRQKESLEVTLGMLDRAESGYAFLKRKGDTIEVSAVAAR